VPAVKAALHRGRARLTELTKREPKTPEHSAELVRYITLFSAGDWDGLRAMLASDVRLDLVDRHRRDGAQDVGIYFTNYERLVVSATLTWRDGQEALIVRENGRDYPVYFNFEDGKIRRIRDYRYAQGTQ